MEAIAELQVSPNPLGWTCSGSRYTPLHYAAYYGHLEVCRLLLQCKANVDARDCGQQSPLTLAISHGHIEVCELLLQCNADVEARNSSGWTGLHHAVYHNSMKVCRLLIDSKANVTGMDRFSPSYITIL